ncbi:FixH family protein [Leptobacterium sp. I13]|uniref:FixH family protein n=1 Tax=Leptobacterium meishanense TaxID=3128904 RepID=UPI0030EC2E06
MKLNWGTGIVIAFILFISFIMYFVITMNTNKKYDHDLVTEEYYKKELDFQNEIDKEQFAITSGMVPSVHKTKEGLLIIFPENITDFSKISGKVFLYRPSDKQLDFEIPISISNSHLLIPNARLLGGRWNIDIDWQYNDQLFLSKKEINY